jgi:hypothetical protein
MGKPGVHKGSNEGGSIGDDVVSVSTLDKWDLPPSMFHKEWKSFLIHFHNFAEQPTTKGHSLESPEFTCNGQKWSLRLYPSGNIPTTYDSCGDALLFSEGCCFAGDVSNSGYVSLYLNHRSRGSATATFEVKIINKFGDTLETRRSSNNRHFDSSSSNSGWGNIIKLSDVLDESKDILDSNGTLTVVVSMMPTQEPPSESGPVPKLASARLDDVPLGLPSEPSWMKPPVIVGTLSNEGVEVDSLDFPRRSVSIDCCSTHSVDPPDVADAVGSLLSVRDSWTDSGRSDCRHDDEVSNEGGSIGDDAVSVSTLDMWDLPPSMFHKEWKSFLIHFHDFAEQPTTKGHSLESPEFTCNNGQKWSLRLYPGGNTSDSDNGYISLYLNHRSRGSATATFEVKIINKFGDTLETRRSSNNRHFDSSSSNSGWGNVIKLSDVLDESKDILDSNGTLTVVVSMKNVPQPIQQPIDPHSELVLKKLVVKCLLSNQLLPENTIIGSRGRGKVLKLQRDPSLESLEKNTRDPPELVGQTSSFHHPCYFVRQPERHVRVLQSSSRDVLSQPPRPEEVRYQLYSSSGKHQPPKSVCTAPVQNDFYSSQQTFCSVPGQNHVGERGISSHAMDRRRHYKEMLLQQQLAQTQAQLAKAQRQLAGDHFSISS